MKDLLKRNWDQKRKQTQAYYKGLAEMLDLVEGYKGIKEMIIKEAKKARNKALILKK